MNPVPRLFLAVLVLNQNPAWKNRGVSQTRKNRAYAWVAFVLAHASVVVHLQSYGDLAFRDVYLYHYWQRLSATPVFAMDWVYPLGALIPMRLIAFVQDPEQYLWAWLALVTVVNALVLRVVLTRMRNPVTVGIWWMVFLAAIGPVGFSRIDAFTSALGILAVVTLANQRFMSSAFIATAGWMKVTHFFWLPVLFVTSKRPWKHVVWPVVLVSAVFAAVAWFGGAGARTWSFVTNQGDRGLQVESVLGSWFHFQRLQGSGPDIEYDTTIFTIEFVGERPDLIARYSDYVMFAMVGIITLLAYRAMRKRRSESFLWAMWGILGVTAVLLTFNKVGSPQLLMALAAPVMLLISRAGVDVKRSTAGIIGVLVVFAAVVGQMVYPFFYQEFFDANRVILALFFLRSMVLIGLVVSAIYVLFSRPSNLRARSRS